MPKQLLASLESAKEKQKHQKAVRLICAAIREIIDHRKERGSWAEEPIICSALLLFVKMNTSFLLVSSLYINGIVKDFKITLLVPFWDLTTSL